MAEDLVPTGAPYGERQNTVVAMRQAGLPLQSTPAETPQPNAAVGGAGSPLPAPSPSAPASAIDFLMGHAPGDFPFATEDSATLAPSAEQPDSPLTALAASAQSSFGLAVLQRIQGR